MTNNSLSHPASTGNLYDQVSMKGLLQGSTQPFSSWGLDPEALALHVLQTEVLVHNGSLALGCKENAGQPAQILGEGPFP